MSMNSTKPSVLVVDDDAAQTRLVARWLEREHQPIVADSAELALRRLSEVLPAAVLMDIHLGGMDGLEALRRVRKHHPDVPVVMLTGDTSVPAVVEAMQAGAWDYLVKPVDRTKLMTTVRNAVERSQLQVRVRHLERTASGGGYGGLLGRSPVMERMFQQLDRVAVSEITVLVQGESGTGKELIANALHDHSGRADGPFVAINCAAVPESLQESELFGHEKGAFTGATERRIGRFEQAHGGTLFLDEVGELSPALQAKLLRVLQERRFYRLGGSTEHRVDVRILAATHRDLSAQVRDGTFREDLFYRLAVFELAVPPLRDRRGDVELLAEHFLAQLCESQGIGPMVLDAEARALLAGYAWPGNVRELHNALERAVVIALGGVITADDLPPRIRAPHPRTPMAPAASVAVPAEAPSAVAEAPPELNLNPVQAMERTMIIDALRAANGNVSEVIRTLEIPRTSLYRKFKQYKISRK
jgi:DNA-binding NtrC family response regulator